MSTGRALLHAALFVVASAAIAGAQTVGTALDFDGDGTPI